MAKFSVSIGKVNNVEWMNGIVQRLNVKLNVRVFLDNGVLIDTGCASMQRQFTEWMNDKEINAVFLTHSHEDHVGACKWLQEVKHTPIYLHEDSLLPVSQKASYPYYRKVFWGEREPFSAQPMFDEIQVNNSKWLSIHTPGLARTTTAFLIIRAEIYIVEIYLFILQQK